MSTIRALIEIPSGARSSRLYLVYMTAAMILTYALEYLATRDLGHLAFGMIWVIGGAYGPMAAIRDADKVESAEDAGKLRRAAVRLSCVFAAAALYVNSVH